MINTRQHLAEFVQVAKSFLEAGSRSRTPISATPLRFATVPPEPSVNMWLSAQNILKKSNAKTASDCTYYVFLVRESWGTHKKPLYFISNVSAFETTSGNQTMNDAALRVHELAQRYEEHQWKTPKEFNQFCNLYHFVEWVSNDTNANIPFWYCHCVEYAREHICRHTVTIGILRKELEVPVEVSYQSYLSYV